MSGFVPRRVSMTRTASATTDIKAAKNTNHIISTIGRRSTLAHSIKTRSFGSMWQIDYANAAGDKCKQEELAPLRSLGTFVLVKDVSYNLELFQDNTTRGFVKKSLKNELVAKKYAGVFTDNTCGFGAINNYPQNILLPTDYNSGDATANAALRGKEILAIEQWYSGSTPPGNGWTGFSNIPAGSINKSSVVLLIATEFTGFTFDKCPIINIMGIDYSPRAAFGPNGYHGITTYGNATGAIKFTAVLYGGVQDTITLTTGADDYLSNITQNPTATGGQTLTTLTTTSSNGSGAQLTVVTSSVGVKLQAMSNLSTNTTDATPSTTSTLVQITSATGSGATGATGAIFTLVTDAAGVVTSATATAAGSGYNIGDQLTLVVPGASTNLVITLAVADMASVASAVSSVTVTAAGSGYKENDTLTVDSSQIPGATDDFIIKFPSEPSAVLNDAFEGLFPSAPHILNFIVKDNP